MNKGGIAGVIAAAVGVLALPVLVLGGGPGAALSCSGAAVSAAALTEHSVPGFDKDQLDNAAVIVNTAATMGLSEKAQLVGITVALGESGLRNVAYGDDLHGVTNPDGTLTCSLGLFQQQWCLPGHPWGDRDDVLDPATASQSFFGRLVKVDGWEELSVTAAGHAVQGNADPNHYAKYEKQAQQIVDAAGGGGCSSGTANGDWQLPVDAPVTSPYGPREIICNAAGCSTPFHYGLDFGAGCGTEIRAIGGGTVTFTGAAGAFGNRVIIDHGGGIESIYGHVSGTFPVKEGEAIPAGTVVATVGGTGVGTGCHLDLKIQVDGEHTDPQAFLQERGLDV